MTQRSTARQRTGRREFLRSILGVSLAARGASAFSATWPARTVRIIVPWPAGGAGDVTVRLLADRLGQTTRQSVVVENRPGAAGTIGLAVAVKALPDGHTLVLGSINDLAVAPASMRELPFDPERDLVPVIHLISAPQVLVVGKASGPPTIREFIAGLRQRTDPARMASGGVGTVGHYAAQMLARELGVRIVPVPYKGGAPAAMAIANGETEFGFQFLASALGMVEAGQLRPLMVLGSRRLATLPGVPAATEVGLRQLDIPSWAGLLAPARTPPETVLQANAAIAAGIRHPEVVRVLSKSGTQVAGGTPEEFGALIRVERARWRRLVAESDQDPS